MQASSPNSDGGVWRDFNALCDCGGRRAGSAGERRALAFAQERLAAIGAAVRVHPVRYPGWRLKEAALTLEDGTALACNPLLGSQSTPADGLSAPVCDLGRGSSQDFERESGRIRNCFVLVRHEYPFSPQHIHRRRKLGWAMERGAAGFIIAHPGRGAGPVSGSSGRAGQDGIPAVGTDFESACRLSAGGRASLSVSGEDYDAETSIFTLELPGRKAEWVVLSAHLDGHDLAESAMDNATGVAAALAVARVLAPEIARHSRGLRVCLFSAEEWALAGSKAYLDAMSSDEKKTIALNINLDTVGGDAHLTALTSGFPRLESLVRESGQGLPTYAPMMPNSDHYNFARHGIPAMRLVAGFNRPESNVRHILTRGDTRDKVDPHELETAIRVTAALVRHALTKSEPI
jgi:Iap family predicted aminopeptidase